MLHNVNRFSRSDIIACFLGSLVWIRVPEAESPSVMKSSAPVLFNAILSFLGIGLPLAF